MTATLAQPVPVQIHPRLAAFCAPNGQEVFSAIVHENQVWMPDPFDIEAIHGEAREVFDRLVSRAASSPPPSTGKILLLLGEAGSGKTHLMRAFRSRVHHDGTGYFAYMQMVTQVDNYAQYVLSKLIEGLDRPYRYPDPLSGLRRLTRGLLDSLDSIPAEERQRFCDEPPEPAKMVPLVRQFAAVAANNPLIKGKGIDIELIRALLYLFSPDGEINQLVLKWLRCEDLGREDRELLGGIVPRTQRNMPLQTIIELGRLMTAVQGRSLVICVDQIEEMIDRSAKDKDPGQAFRHAIDTLVAIVDAVPTAVVVVACLEDFFVPGRAYLMKPKLDRLERDPDPLRLSSKRTLTEIEAMIGRRLESLYESHGIASDPVQPTFPFRQESLQPLTGLRTRDILDWCRRHQELCTQSGLWLEPEQPPPKPKPPEKNEKVAIPDTLPLKQLWNDFLAGHKNTVGVEEEERTALLTWAIREVSEEMPTGIHFGAETNGRFIPVEAHGPGNTVDQILVALCEKNPRGGGLGNELRELAQKAGEIPAVIVRSTPFPNSAAGLIADLIPPKGKGRRTVVEDSDWRSMAAFCDFHKERGNDPAFTAWRKEDRPLSGLPAIRTILALDHVLEFAPTSALSPKDTVELPPPAPASVSPKAAPVPVPALETGPLTLGVLRGPTATPVLIEARELTQHAAFLGGSGSGKTTAALNLIEQLILRGVPAVLIDRKGDLARYADPIAWTVTESDPIRAERRRKLKQRLEVVLFTPGAAQGQPLTLPIAPADMHQLPAAEREQLATYVATALGRMMGYRPRGVDPKLAILGKAIEVLARQPGRPVSVRGLQKLIEEREESLLLAVEGFDDKHFKKLAQDLLALLLQRQQLLEGGGNTLEMDALLGCGSFARPGKTRLAIINTQFLGGSDAVDFWLAQFLIAVERWATRHPSADSLQAVFLFDEADQYLPATRQPATKAPLENLLRRARSAGLGLFLATQSPGDLDYKCRDQIRNWLIGRVKEHVAFNKLKPMLEAGNIDPAARLPGQGTGQFYLARERDVKAVQTEPSLVQTAQLPEARILELARATGATASSHVPLAKARSGAWESDKLF